MKNILFVGENPLGFTGNSLMMASILEQIDPEKYNSICFSAGSDSFQNYNLFTKTPFQIIPAEDYKSGDMWGSHKLLKVISNNPINYLVMIGIDIWRYSNIMDQLLALKSEKKFKWLWLFPYDLKDVRKDWVNLINQVDLPMVYSEYGFLALQSFCPNLKYFRPPMFMRDSFVPLNEKERIAARREIFPTISDETFVYGFVGVNQVRKDAQRLLRAFSDVKPYLTKPSVLYLHTDLTSGVYNLKQYALDCGLQNGDILTKTQGSNFPFHSMPKLYNALDCLVNCSMQEGLSWTVIQALACGTPTILSYTTAHRDFKDFPGTVFVPMADLAYIPLQSSGGNTWVESHACSLVFLKDQLEFVQNEKVDKKKISDRMHLFLDKSSNLNDVLDKQENTIEIITPKKKEVLFVQHSAAGDVLMTTRCFKGIKEKNPGKKLIYMTQKQYQLILKNNPYIDGVIDWNEREINNYDIVYNPHGDHILPGGFNSLDVKLADMYPYFCKVKPDDFYIWCEETKIPDTSYVVVHTTGGNPLHRTYAHMSMVIKGLKIPVVQIGSKTDLYCEGAEDYRGLNFNQTSYVMDNAAAAVVIDSFPSHLAGALKTPVVVLFGPAPSRVVAPISDPDKLICIEADKLRVCKGLTACWSQARDCQSPCINTISPLEVRKALLSLLEGK